MLSLVFPKLCMGCSSESTQKHLCENCFSLISFLKEVSSCLVCGVPFGSQHDEGIDNEFLCSRCLSEEFYFERARSIAIYDGFLRRLLHDFKYHGNLSLGKLFSFLTMEYFPQQEFIDFDLIVPVPLHISKLRKREYNQSTILAYSLSKDLMVSCNPFAIVKINDTNPQVDFKTVLNRKKNVRNSFIVGDKAKLKGKSVLLVDDVFTTGSTTNECSRLLLKAGAKVVQVFTVMRASI